MSITKTPRVKAANAATEAKKVQKKKNEAARRNRKNNLSAAQMEAMTTARLETQRAYHEAIEELLKYQDEVARELAAKFNKSLATVLLDVQYRGKLSRRREVNPYNAWNHFKKMDLLTGGELPRQLRHFIVCE